MIALIDDYQGEEHKTSKDHHEMLDANHLPYLVLSPTSIRFLNSLGILSLVPNGNKTFFNNFFMYEDFGDSYVNFTSDQRKSSTLVNLEQNFLKSFILRDDASRHAFDQSQTNLGLLVKREDINRALDQKIKESQKCKMIKPCSSHPQEVWRNRTL